jgi:hypothetical protein
MSIWIPEELWYMIFQYMDTPSFYNTIEALRGIYPDLVEALMTTICYKVIKKHPKVRMMNFLYSDLNYFRKRENYLIYRNFYLNNFFLDKNKQREISIGELNRLELTERNYRDFLSSNLETKGEIKDKKMFKNLTKRHNSHSYSDYELARHNNFNYNSISIKLEDVFNYTCNQNRKEYLQLVRFRCQLY